jgi:hypothetical protein
VEGGKAKSTIFKDIFLPENWQGALTVWILVE